MIRRFHRNKFLFIFIGVLALYVTIPFFVDGAGYVSLTGSPGLQDASNLDMEKYVNTLLRIAIIAAALIAVIKLILAGAKYVLSGIVTDKESAKKDIYSAVLGLLIVLGAVTILRTINPQIVNLPAIDPVNVIVTPPVKNAPFELSSGDKFRSCQGKDVPTCKTDICDGVNGTVTTNGVRVSDGATYKEGTPICIFPSTKKSGGTSPPVQIGDVTIAQGLTYDSKIKYDISKIDEFVQKAIQQGIYISHTKILRTDGGTQEKRICEDVDGGRSFIIQGKDLSGDTLLCVK